MTKSVSYNTDSAPYPIIGGIALAPQKRALTGAILEIAPPAHLTIPLLNYQREALRPSVAIGEQVKRGQAIAKGLLASSSGEVVAIESKPIIHPAGLSASCVIIECDGLDTALTTVNSNNATPQHRLQTFINDPAPTIENAALVGLGGAGFPTDQKIWNTHKPTPHTLIINAAECEPEIACDEALMEQDATAIAWGVQTLVALTQCEHCIVAIEDSKPAAIDAMRNALESIQSDARLLIIPTKYPTGAESTLIKAVTGVHLPYNKKPIDHGFVCINVATAHALWRAINGTALDSRIVSLGGDGMSNPCNVRVRFGSSIDYVLSQTNNAAALDNTQLRVGGPLSGFNISNAYLPVTARTNCILATTTTQPSAVLACIRCGDCADVCPATLLPQQLHWHAVADNISTCTQLNLDACIECGCCDLVCPSNIPLTETFRYAKSQQRAIEIEEQRAQKAEQTFAAREIRLARLEQEKAEAIAQRKKTIAARAKQRADKPINDAIARAKARAQNRARNKPSGQPD